MKITYYLEDGYAGSKSRPRHVNIGEEDIQDCESQEDFETMVETLVNEDFQNNVSVSYTCPKWPGKKETAED